MRGEREQRTGEEDRRRLLVVRSGGERFTMDIASITEIVVDGQITPVPLAPRQVVGVINHRGRVFTVVSFAALAGLADEATGNLDPKDKGRSRDRLCSAVEEHGATLLAVTHDHELRPRVDRTVDFTDFREEGGV